MSLLDEYSESFVIMDKSRVSDGLGGYITTWTESVEIKGALAPASETEMKLADAKGLKITNVLVTSKDNALDYHDVLKRKSDGQIYRVTSIGKDVVTPGSSALNLRKIGLEVWEIPSEELND